MNGKTWRIALCTAMLEYGEDQVSGQDVAYIANEMFPASPFPAWVDDAEIELREFRKHLRFLREPDIAKRPAPTLYEQLKWALTTQLRPSHPIVRQFIAFLIHHRCRDPQLREMVNVREPTFEKSGPTSRPQRRVYSEARRYSDAFAAWGNSAGEGNESIFK